MMRRQQSQDNFLEAEDEHNQPTEPMPHIFPLPIFVGMFFIAVQLLLLARFVLKLIRWPGSTAWAGTIYSVSNVFVLPFHLLLQNVALPAIFLNTIEIYTLLAILTYWLLSRILVRLLKAILYSS